MNDQTPAALPSTPVLPWALTLVLTALATGLPYVVPVLGSPWRELATGATAAIGAVVAGVQQRALAAHGTASAAAGAAQATPFPASGMRDGSA